VIGVLVVDDSAVIRRMITSILEGDPEIQVVGTASNGRVALERLAELTPDIVILDVEMPVMDGLATLRSLRALGSRNATLPVVMFSALTERGAAATLDALTAGATDYVTKPAGAGSVAVSLDQVRRELVPKVKALVAASRDRLAAGSPIGGSVVGSAVASGAITNSAVTGNTVTSRLASVAPAQGALAVPRRPLRSDRVEVVAIGCSTGGPDALATVLGALPIDFPVPILVVQHMPPLFTRMFAERLDRSSVLPVAEAVDGQRLSPGAILVAPGDRHLRVRRDGVSVCVDLSEEPPENYCRPAVDVLFRSIAEVFGPAALACVLTGMGRDGEQGAGRVRAGGGRIVVQDQATSVVWGMPGAVAKAGLADDVVPLSKIAETLLAAVTPRRSERVGVR
jgi:two-component system, chemotaxis family, protein-glutamate methylesterase/glutaminase